MVEHNVPSKLYITEEEFSMLLLHADSTQVIDAGFGLNRVWLNEVRANAWAFTLLLAWRKVTT